MIQKKNKIEDYITGIYRYNSSYIRQYIQENISKTMKTCHEEEVISNKKREHILRIDCYKLSIN